jgi:hypothetical protein
MQTLHSAILFVALAFTSPLQIIAQNNTTNEDVSAILLKDSLFWQHYNNCNVEAMRDFFTADVEFYHDKGGMIKGLDQFLTVSKQNLCSNANFRLKREAVAGTVHAALLKNNDIVYGAILSGQHVFYIIENGGEPRLDGLAKFTHLFLKTEGDWKMSRILSYDHGPAPYTNKRKEIVLGKNDLKGWVGKYQSQQGLCSIKDDGKLLLLTVDGNTYTLHPETKQLFFVTDRDLTFEFSSNKMIIRERGQIVDEAIRVQH